jgi:hypothetical protein
VSSKPGHSAGGETTPLLASSAGRANGGRWLQTTTTPRKDDEDDDDDKPLPIGQIFLLCYARLVEPIAFFSIFPFINKMIFETGDLEEVDVGFYSGLIVSSWSYSWSSCRVGA